MKEILEKLLKKEENILFVYLFGSFATLKATKRECDLVVLNNAKNLYLLEEIITKGILLKDDKEKRELLSTRR